MRSSEDTGLNLPKETFQPVISNSMELEQWMDSGFTLCIHTLAGIRQMKTCYGDIVKIVNALRDYARILEMGCVQWHLEGFHLASYQCHADKLRHIADKFQDGIGYDYDAALERCKKRREHPKRDEGIGEEAMMLAVRSASEQAARKAAAKEAREGK